MKHRDSTNTAVGPIRCITNARQVSVRLAICEANQKGSLLKIPRQTAWNEKPVANAPAQGRRPSPDEGSCRCHPVTPTFDFSAYGRRGGAKRGQARAEQRACCAVLTIGAPEPLLAVDLRLRRAISAESVSSGETKADNCARGGECKRSRQTTGAAGGPGRARPQAACTSKPGEARVLFRSPKVEARA
jgi:hypothetical protein|eukprot:COSAG06_NODE_2081_length_7638_cov_33.282266_1_plen_188_part_00